MKTAANKPTATIKELKQYVELSEKLGISLSATALKKAIKRVK